MMYFVEEKGKLKAGVGHTDDRVMASAIALKIIDSTPGLHSERQSDILWELEKSFPRNKRKSPSDSWPMARRPFGETSLPTPEFDRGRKVSRLGRSY